MVLDLLGRLRVFEASLDRPKSNYSAKTAGKGNGGRVCTYCGKEGHLARQCFKRKRAAKNQNAPKSDQPANHAMHTALHASTKSSMHAWVVDSGASAHTASDPSLFFEYRELSDTVKYADGSVGMVDGVGSVSVIFNGFAITLHEVLCVPSLSGNLFSVTAAAAHGAEVKFTKLGCEFVCSDQERFLVP